MNAHTFDSHSVVCPICHRTGPIHPGQMLGGLYTCPHCQARLVISLSGHYVRDPFTFRQAPVEQLLRRQSRPWARILRDVGLTKPVSLMALLVSAVVAGVTLAVIQGWSFERDPVPDALEAPHETISSVEDSL
ncbi:MULTISPECIES: hypothetical protein [Planktothricoides]|uniref:Uncharacterized protein n=2 Tax=Planktothricoides raciborskii TaxID=132608 RepID=A0AAU8JBN6_9CYAN|nr:MULTISPECIES: hypothetical protein [Planktothricoides]KOR36247.1 hypothetical protein AM228_13520 [Planktothricoides sp. SR001]MBD2544848.1 hypothetical protein [Planktothricoides raciborskii FACHB-1370]MBD2583056.1 hypothetical protein [Planktothricoides raciborskii FACHB-1261]